MPQKISDILDPMELSNDMSTFMKIIENDDFSLSVANASFKIAQEMCESISTEAEANRGAVIVAATIMELLLQIGELADNKELEEAFLLFHTAISIGIPAILLSLMSSDNVINAKIFLEGSSHGS